jgi:hypothetical protein
MIGDISRTGTYRKAILGNGAVAIKDKIVLDVGAGEWCECFRCHRRLSEIGSGILSFMSAQAGASHVIALEASSMAEKVSLVGPAVLVSIGAMAQLKPAASQSCQFGTFQSAPQGQGPRCKRHGGGSRCTGDGLAQWQGGHHRFGAYRRYAAARADGEFLRVQPGSIIAC